MKRLIGLCLALLVAVPLYAAAGKIEFADAPFPDGNVAESFQAGDFTQLYARAHFPKKLGAMKFDKMQVILENVDGTGIYKGLTVGRGNIGERWMNVNYMDFDVINASGGSEFKDFNEYKEMTMDDIAGKPMREGVKEQTIMLTVTLFQITGYSKKTVWDDWDKAWVEKKTPIYGKGNTISKGKVVIIQKESAVANGFEDKGGLWAIPYSDLVPKGSDVSNYSTPVTVSGFSTGHDKDATYPIGYFLNGFGVETAKLPAGIQTMDGLKASLAGADARNDMGWSYFIDGIRNMERSRGINLNTTAANIGGNAGERIIFTAARGFAVIYLLQKGAYTYVFWFDLGYADYGTWQTDQKNTIWEEKFTEQQRQAHLAAFDSIMASIKILK